MDERRLEIKVGALLGVALLAMVGLLALMGELGFQRGAPLVVAFSHTGNVVKGAPVKLAGVQVGRVEEVRLTADRRDAAGLPLPVEIETSVEPPVLAVLRQDARVTVSSVGPLGEPYLELNPGSADAPRFEPGTTLRGVDAPRLDLVAARLSAFLEAASEVLEDDPESMKRLILGLGSLAEELDGFLKQNGGELTVITEELSLAAKDLRLLAATGRKALEPGGPATGLLDDAAASAKLLRQELPAITENANKALGGLAAVSGEFTREDGVRAKQALASMQQLAVRGERILARIEAGEGTIGNLQKDPQLAEDLRELVRDLKAHPWKVLWKE